MTHRRGLVAAVAVLASCGVGVDDGNFASASAESGGTGDGSATDGADSNGQDGPASGQDDSGDEGMGVKYDLEVPETTGDGGPGGDVCEVGPDGDAGQCTDQAPPDSFDPVVQWTWDGQGTETNVVATPLVVNLTDDNGDGDVDLCDVPDVVVVAYTTPNLAWDDNDQEIGHVYVLDGATGSVHYRIEHPVSADAHPAVGDIDGDGLPEIVTVQADESNVQGVAPELMAEGARFIAFEHDGALSWVGEPGTMLPGTAVALADLDNDGDAEILGTAMVADHEGHTLWTQSYYYRAAPTAADLDDDGDLEVILDGNAYHHDGTLLFPFSYPCGNGQCGGQGGIPQVADLDADGRPEILHTSGVIGQIAVTEHDGTVSQVIATGASLPPFVVTIHDIDGDHLPELIGGSPGAILATEHDLTPKWSVDAAQVGGSAPTAAAFDFLGDGTAEVLYANENALRVLDGTTGALVLQWPRSSWVSIEFPVVADVDNDGSADIVVTSNDGQFGEGQTAPAVQVIQDAQDRWIPARRIWNQHTYHVTNVHEDGGIPQFEVPHWTQLNTYRTQAQIHAGGGVCQPEPAG